ENDNQWSAQWVWSPLPLAKAVPQQRVAPPPAGALAQPNSDGFTYARPADFGWGVGMINEAALDDYDLDVYDDYDSSASGFSSLLARSSLGPGETELVVGNAFATPTTVYPAAVRGSSRIGRGFFLDQTDAVGRQGPGTGAAWLNQLLETNRVADVYDVDLA